MTTTIRDIMDAGWWAKFCDLRGWSVWCVNEGRANSDDEVAITGVELKALFGITPAPEPTTPDSAACLHDALAMARSIIYNNVPGAVWNQLEKEIALIDAALALPREDQS